jgi:hypothetical protein
VQFVVYSPPGTAVFHRVNEGWTADTHKVSDLIEWVKMLICINAEDPDKAYQQLGREKRPGVEEPTPEQVMTIGEYMQRAGLEG